VVAAAAIIDRADNAAQPLRFRTATLEAHQRKTVNRELLSVD